MVCSIKRIVYIQYITIDVAKASSLIWRYGCYACCYSLLRPFCVTAWTHITIMTQLHIISPNSIQTGLNLIMDPMMEEICTAGNVWLYITPPLDWTMSTSVSFHFSYYYLYLRLILTGHCILRLTLLNLSLHTQHVDAQPFLLLTGERRAVMTLLILFFSSASFTLMWSLMSVVSTLQGWVQCYANLQQGYVCLGCLRMGNLWIYTEALTKTGELDDW